MDSKGPDLILNFFRRLAEAKFLGSTLPTSRKAPKREKQRKARPLWRILTPHSLSCGLEIREVWTLGASLSGQKAVWNRGILAMNPTTQSMSLQSCWFNLNTHLFSVCRYRLLISKGLAPKCVVDLSWNTAQVGSAVKNIIQQNAYIGRCLERVGASWRDIRLCDCMSRGSRRKRAMSPQLEMGNITMNDLLMWEPLVIVHLTALIVKSSGVRKQRRR